MLFFDRFTQCDPVFQLAQKLGINLFANINKKVAVRRWWLWEGSQYEPEDLSWADLVICYTGEIIQGPWDWYKQQTIKHFNNPNFICVNSGLWNLHDYPQDCVYDRLRWFFLYLTDICYYEPWQTGQQTKLFDVLLGTTKPHRVFIFEQLTENNLLEKSLVNIWPGAPHDEKLVDYTSPDLARVEDPVLVANPPPPIHMPGGMLKHNSQFGMTGIHNGISMSQSIPIGIYKDTWYSIVAETKWNNSNFLTEKTAKPLLEKRIFVLFGSQGLLKTLHNFGFRTFDSIIDESYDQEPDDYKRWTKAFDQVLLLASLDPISTYHKVSDVLDHNHAVILDQTSMLNDLKNFLHSHII